MGVAACTLPARNEKKKCQQKWLFLHKKKSFSVCARWQVCGSRDTSVRLLGDSSGLMGSKTIRLREPLVWMSESFLRRNRPIGCFFCRFWNERATWTIQRHARKCRRRWPRCAEGLTRKRWQAGLLFQPLCNDRKGAVALQGLVLLG